jgi:hypothetical protein
MLPLSVSIRWRCYIVATSLATKFCCAVRHCFKASQCQVQLLPKAVLSRSSSQGILTIVGQVCEVNARHSLEGVFPQGCTLRKTVRGSVPYSLTSTIDNPCKRCWVSIWVSKGKKKYPGSIAICSMNQGSSIRSVPLSIGGFELSAVCLWLFVAVPRVLRFFASRSWLFATIV